MPSPYAGHFWTLAPALLSEIPGVRRVAFPAPVSAAWSTPFDDPRLTDTVLSGKLCRTGSAACIVLVHGLGGHAESFYVRAAARVAARLGFDSLRFGLRGANQSGHGLYHCGMWMDVAAALQSEALQAYEHIAVLGYSLGAQVALNYGCIEHDARLRCLAAVCPPIDLTAMGPVLDANPLYRRGMLMSINRVYRAFWRRHQRVIGSDLPHPRDLRDFRTFAQWDDAITAPWGGFRSAAHYYESVSVSQRLHDLRVPTAIVLGRHDPVLPPAVIAKALDDVPAHVEVYWAAGGHVGMPPRVQLQQSGRAGLAPQVLGWVRSQLLRVM